ncbi:MAG TPA: hypothetical protein VE776_15800 [Actinomycetota bacterium]|nr:hypothetical protein [Actinomycetota bacterium]
MPRSSVADGEQAQQARRLARTARSRLASRLGWRRRAAAVLSPASLVPRRERMGSSR